MPLIWFRTNVIIGRSVVEIAFRATLDIASVRAKHFPFAIARRFGISPYLQDCLRTCKGGAVNASSESESRSEGVGLDDDCKDLLARRESAFQRSDKVFTL